ncbi:hypothetical protein ONZ45_g10020 [Pleurotus djamor]|nr:hypothetical protein ONZ45_g10020 [Pleurotus djamor]
MSSESEPVFDDTANNTASLGKRRRLNNDLGVHQSLTHLDPSDLCSVLRTLAESFFDAAKVSQSLESQARKTSVTFKLTHTIVLQSALSDENRRPSLDLLYAELHALSTKARCTSKTAPFWIRPIFQRIEPLLPPGQILFISPDDVGGPEGEFTDWRLILAPQASMNPMNLNGLIVEPDGEEASQATNFYFMDASRYTKGGKVSIDDPVITNLALHNMHHLAVKCEKSIIRGVITDGIEYVFLMLPIPKPHTVTCNYASSVPFGLQWNENSILHRRTVDIISSAVAQWAMDSNNPEIDEQWFKLEPYPWNKCD